MCGRYTLTKTDKLKKRYNLANVPDDLKANYNTAPGQFMPVITEDDKGRSLHLMKWGLIPVWAKDPNIGYKMINARAETIFEKPAWRNVIKRKRCLIPADGFYEWKRDNKGTKEVKHPFFIHPKDAEVFSFAGIWETWKDVENHEWNTYSVITTEPNKEMAGIHDRMPVILHQDDESSWLSPSNNDDRSVIETYLRPFEDNGLEMYEVSSDVNSVKNNSAELLQPVVQ